MSAPRHHSSLLAALPLALLLTLGGCERAAQDGAAAPQASADVAEPTRPSRAYTIEEFVDGLQLGGASFSPDQQQVLFSANRDGVWNAWTIPAAGGEWTPVTTSTTDNNYAVAFFPADQRKLVTRDQGGDELNHLYVIAEDGSERDLTPGQNLKASFAGFSHDGGAFFVQSNERDPKYMDLYRYDSADYARTLLYRNDEAYDIGAISPDARFIALQKNHTTADNDLYLLELASGKLTHLSPHAGQAVFAAQDFAVDSGHLLYTTNVGSEFMRLRRYDIASGEHADVEAADWDIQYSYYSHNGRYRVTATNVDGSTAIAVVEVASNRPVTLPELPAGEISGVNIARSEERMAFYLNGDRQPNDLYVLAFGDAQPTRLTQSLNQAIDPADLVDSEVVRFASFDGMQIPNILYKPHQASAETPAPALVWVHGGPGGQTTRGFSAVRQYLANHGYVVLGINNRGSSGYGQSFFTADDGKHGREPLWDVIEAKKYLASLPYVDAERIGIIGGSYGGYMVLSAMAFHPEEFDVGVDIFGVSNWLRTLENIPPYWESFRNALYVEIGNPATQRDFLIATSPLFHAEKIARPLMVLQGANDPRVIQAESDDIVAAVRKNGVPVEYVVFEDEGHGFGKKDNQIEGYGKVLAFLDQHLKNKPAAH